MRSPLRYGIVGGSGYRGYPFSLTREMSIRFFGYFASKRTERAASVAISRLPMPRILRQERSKYPCRSSFAPPPCLWPFTPSGSPSIHGQQCTPFDLSLGPLVFLTLLFGSHLSRRLYPLAARSCSERSQSRESFGFPLFGPRSRTRATRGFIRRDIRRMYLGPRGCFFIWEGSSSLWSLEKRPEKYL